ncbi:translation initiation factor IF-2-like [Panicum virgatum]|nr:translation initiation factor IF-2-like [Panicum virgatum]XP_039823963.1 translation initiation factor IF-2-like [Panicum virgatum]
MVRRRSRGSRRAAPRAPQICAATTATSSSCSPPLPPPPPRCNAPPPLPPPRNSAPPPPWRPACPSRATPSLDQPAPPPVRSPPSLLLPSPAASMRRSGRAGSCVVGGGEAGAGRAGGRASGGAQPPCQRSPTTATTKAGPPELLQAHQRDAVWARRSPRSAGGRRAAVSARQRGRATMVSRGERGCRGLGLGRQRLHDVVHQSRGEGACPGDGVGGEPLLEAQRGGLLLHHGEQADDGVHRRRHSVACRAARGRSSPQSRPRARSSRAPAPRAAAPACAGAATSLRLLQHRSMGERHGNLVGDGLHDLQILVAPSPRRCR